MRLIFFSKRTLSCILPQNRKKNRKSQKVSIKRCPLIFSFCSFVFVLMASGVVLRVGLTGDYPPFSKDDTLSQPSFQGIDVEIAKRLATHLKREVLFVKTSWKEGLSDLLQGKFDVMMGGLSVSAERLQSPILFTVPYLTTYKAPISRCERSFDSIDSINQPNVKVIVNPGGINEKFAKTHFPRAQLTVASDNSVVFEKIAQQNADVMITDLIECEWLSKTRYRQILAPGPPFLGHSVQKAYMVRKEDKVLLDRIDVWLKEEIESGRVQETIEKFLTFSFN